LRRPRKGETAPPEHAGGSPILVGAFGAAHGVRGEVRVKSYTADPAAIAGYGPLRDQAGTRTFEIEALRPLRDDLFVARIKDVRDRNSAEALANIGLYISRDRLDPLDDDEFLHADLIGLRAETPEGVVVGTIIAVHNFGAGDLLEIAPPAGETQLRAFTRANVPQIDLDGGRAIVHLPVETTGEERQADKE
jgi:16S rRNA processing protein RimM